MSISLTFTFPGCCADAMALYEKAFGASVKHQLRYKDAQVVLPVDKPFENMIYHAEMDILGTRAMLADEIMERAPAGAPTLSLTVSLPNPKAVRDAYDVLRPGGTVVKAMRMTAFSACVVTIADRFGVKWGLMTEAAPEFLIRDVRKEDADAICGVMDDSISAACEDAEAPAARRQWAEGFLDRARQEIEGGGYRGLVMEYEQGPRGVALYAPGRSNGLAELTAFYLAHNIWGIGAGRYLMDATIAKMHADGYTRARLWAPSDDMRARFFFDDCGFSLSGEERSTRVHAKGLNYMEVRYELNLAEYGS